jgi:hypothetical protein
MAEEEMNTDTTEARQMELVAVGQLTNILSREFFGSP